MNFLSKSLDVSAVSQAGRILGNFLASYVRSSLKIQIRSPVALSFRIFFGERPRVYVTYPGGIELKTELKQCCKTCEHDSGTTINAKMI